MNNILLYGIILLLIGVVNNINHIVNIQIFYIPDKLKIFYELMLIVLILVLNNIYPLCNDVILHCFLISLLYFKFMIHVFKGMSLLDRAIHYFIISITVQTFFYYIILNIVFMDSLLQSIGLSFLYTDFVVESLNKSPIIFFNHILNFFFCSYILTNDKIKNI